MWGCGVHPRLGLCAQVNEYVCFSLGSALWVEVPWRPAARDFSGLLAGIETDLLSGFSSSVLGAAPCGSWAGSWGEAGFAADVVASGSATIG